jgi:4-hydroxy-3-methylbut-2-en-1-yl diphosphate reductase
LRKGAPGLPVARTGMGPVRAAQAAEAHTTASAVAIAGVAGALRPGLQPGTVVIADRVLGPAGEEVAVLRSAPALASEVQALGLPVAVGTVISTPEVIRGGDARARLAAMGAIAVDCETASILERFGAVPAAVVRVVADTPERELRSVATIPGGWKALRALSAAAPALQRWADSLGERTVLLAGPRSFCAGVERAIATVEKALDRFGAPVYVRRQIVHNSHVVSDLEQKGAIFVQELDEIPEDATVVFSAHGVSPRVRAEAEVRRLNVVDATCPLVAKVHHEVHRFSQRGYQVVMIGHAGHDETEGTLGESDQVTLIETPDDVATLDVRDPEKIAYITQTTLAPGDVAGIVSRLSERFPALVGPHAADICYATQNRQEALIAMAAECDLVVVVGSSNSSNAARLVEVASREHRPVHLIDGPGELRLEWLPDVQAVGVTAAASTPPRLVDEVVSTLSGLGGVRVEERVVRHENVNFPLPLEVR